VYHHLYFSKGCACDVCDRPCLPSPLLSSHGDYSSTAPAVPSLRPLIPSGSLISCKPVQLYHHHLIFRQCGQNFREWSMLLHLWLLSC
jgi:hypothetical protein